MNKINKLKAERNKITAEISAIESQIKDINTRTIIEEILNLRDGVGNFFSADYYANDRLYSRVPGVKNLRWAWDEEKQRTILVKITSPAGRLLPESVKVEGVEYKIEFIYSDKFDNNLDY